MHFAAFKTDAPLNHLARALDELARAGFSLGAVNVAAGSSSADVRIDFSGTGSVPAETYVARLEKMPGVFAISGSSSRDVEI